MLVCGLQADIYVVWRHEARRLHLSVCLRSGRLTRQPITNQALSAISYHRAQHYQLSPGGITDPGAPPARLEGVTINSPSAAVPHAASGWSARPHHALTSSQQLSPAQHALPRPTQTALHISPRLHPEPKRPHALI